MTDAPKTFSRTTDPSAGALNLRYDEVLFDTIALRKRKLGMRLVFLLVGLSAVSLQAFEIKPCDELKSEIAAKIDAKGVKDYQLEIVAAGDVKDQTVVGSCEGGTKKITYSKGAAGTAPAKAEAPDKPAKAK